MASQITAEMVSSLIHRLTCAVFLDPNTWTKLSSMD